MQIVTDSGTDLSLSKEELADLNIHVVPLNVRLDKITYREGLDITPGEFYPLLEKSKDIPDLPENLGNRCGYPVHPHLIRLKRNL